MGNILRYHKALSKYQDNFGKAPDVFRTWVKNSEQRDICIFICEHALERGTENIEDDLIGFYMKMETYYSKIYEEKYHERFPVSMLDIQSRATLLKEAVERGRPMTQEEVTG
ncbi:MAG: hypothetical protein LUF82_01620 [Clostridia bacterium]|nr:hypothetical protein [Clostridia bacterium]